MKAVLLTAALGLAACSTTGSSTIGLPGQTAGGPRSTTELLGGAPPALLNLALFDAPVAGMQGVKVNIGIDAVQLITAAGTTVPFVTNPAPDVVNLLDLQKFPQAFAGSAPVGAYTGVRVLIDAASSNVKIPPLTIPIRWGTPANPNTAAVVAVDFPVAFTLSGIGAAPKISMDFNVLQSVRFSGNTIYLQPKVAAANAAAQVSGKVKNAAGKPVTTAAVLAVGPLGEVVNSTVTGVDGSFTLHALPAGVYTIEVKNSYVPATGDTVTAANNDAGAAPSTTVVVSPNDSLILPDITD